MAEEAVTAVVMEAPPPAAPEAAAPIAEPTTESQVSMASTVAWTDHKALLLSGIRQLFDSGSHSDFIIRCHQREFRVHKLVLGLFTDYFNKCDGLWIRINVNPALMEKLLRFMYYGQVTVSYDEMEGFLHTCKFLGVKLFKPADVTAEGIRAIDVPSDLRPEQREASSAYQERYELNDFQLMCRACFKCFADDKAMKKHAWACSRPKNFKCRFCARAFRFRNDVENHERVHTGERPFVCPKENCGKTFKLRNARAIHVQTAHEGFSHRCEQCGKGLTSRTKLKDHIAAVHSTDRPFACVECGRCFALNSHLRIHMKGHLPKEKRPRSYVKKKDRKKDLKVEEKVEVKEAEVDESTTVIVTNEGGQAVAVFGDMV